MRDHEPLQEERRVVLEQVEQIRRIQRELLQEAEIHEDALASVSESLQKLDQFWNLARTRVPRAAEPLVGRPVTVEEAQSYFTTTKRSAVAY